MSLFKPCHVCACYPHLYDEEIMPMIDSRGLIVCKKCSNGQALDITEEYYNVYKTEILKANCDCVHENTTKAGYRLNKVTLIVHCKDCKKDEYLNLHSTYPRLLLENITKTMIKDLNLPKEQIRMLSTIEKQEEVEKILMKQRKAMAYVSEKSVCFHHFKETYKYNLERFEFNCDKCPFYSKSIDLCAEGYFYQAINYCKAICSSAKTSAFTSSIMKYLKSTNPHYSIVKNFLYDLKDLHDSRNLPLKDESFCLQCENQFNFSSPPVKIHENELHEICLKCFRSSSTKQCPICTHHFSPSSQLIFPNSLYDLNDKFCCITHENSKFSYFKQRLPYLTPCLHNVCSICYNNQRFNHYGFCLTCERDFSLVECKLNTHLIQKLAFTEILCAVHNEPAIEYFYHNNALSMKCEKCPKVFRHNKKTIGEFKDIINQKLYEILQTDNRIDKNITDVLEYIPLQIRFDLLDEKNRDFQRLFRATLILPFDEKSIAYWYDNGSKNTLMIRSDMVFNLRGFLIGLKNEESSGFKIFLQSNEINFIVYSEGPVGVLIFNEPITIDKPTFFDIQLSKGRYFQIYDPQNLSALNNVKIFNRYDVDLVFNTFESGNMNLGGPFLGIITDSYAWVAH